MAKQASKTVIGVFVVSSIAMLIAGVIVFGSGGLFKKKLKYVMFFEDSVKGLNVGAPVIWHGVQIGSVSSIVLRANPKKLSINIPVVIEVDPSRMEVEGKRFRNPREGMKHMIAKGLRARLVLQSFLTGTSMIDIEFLPGTPVRLTGLDPRYPEIPTIKSAMSKLTQKLEALPFDQIASRLLDVLDHADLLLKDPEIKEMLQNLNKASTKLNGVLADTEKLVVDANFQVNTVSENINGKMNVLSEDMRMTMTSAQKTLQGASTDLEKITQDAGRFIESLNKEIKPIAENIQAVLLAAKMGLNRANQTLSSLEGFLGERSGTRHQLNRALEEIASAARSIKSLMDYLERHPNALLMGKGGAK